MMLFQLLTVFAVGGMTPAVVYAIVNFYRSHERPAGPLWRLANGKTPLDGDPYRSACCRECGQPLKRKR